MAVAKEKGFLAASLDEIAARAGMTKGAIYSNFSGKAELMGRAAELKALQLAPNYVQGASLRTQMQAVARAVMALLPKARGLERLNAEFQTYVLSEPSLRAEVAEVHRAQFNALASTVSEAYGDRITVSPRQFTLAVQALSLGFIHQHQITPDEVTEDVVTAAFEALADGVTKG